MKTLRKKKTSRTQNSTWVFPKIWENHQIIHFNRVFHEINHPFWGTLFLETPTDFFCVEKDSKLPEILGARQKRQTDSPQEVEDRIQMPSLFGCYIKDGGSLYKNKHVLPLSTGAPPIQCINPAEVPHF